MATNLAERQCLSPHIEAVARVAVERGHVCNELRDSSSGPLRHEIENVAGRRRLDNLDWLQVLQVLDEATERAVRAAGSKVTRCDSCTQPLRWVLTVKGKRMPIDPLPHPKGNVVFSSSGGRSVVEVLSRRELPAQGRPAYRPHFSTCPFASHYRRESKSLGPRCVVCQQPMNAEYVAESGDNTHPCCSDVGRIND